MYAVVLFTGFQGQVTGALALVRLQVWVSITLASSR